MHCPCGSALAFNDCCQLFITQKQKPTTAEQLMRSRFSAYATSHGQYIFDTYSMAGKTKQSVEDIQTWADQCIWIALVIHESTEDIIEFSAYYIIDDTLCELRERSNFTLEQGEWRYVDGGITVNDELANIKRNEKCPCNSYSSAWSAKKNKKYKHCCAK